MNSKGPYYILSLLVAISMILAACAPVATATEPPAAQTEPPATTEEPVATEPPTATQEPTAEPTTRRGGWLDEIVVSVVDGDSAVSQIQAGAIDFFSFNLASSAFLPSKRRACHRPSRSAVIMESA